MKVDNSTAYCNLYEIYIIINSISPWHGNLVKICATLTSYVKPLN